jgi:perosamine synthetase
VKAGSEVIVPAYSCVSVLNAVLALGATPVLADVELDRWTLDPSSAAEQKTPRTAAAIAVHLFGMPARIGALRDLGVPIIEDCAHGIGGRVEGRPFGSVGAASIGSFYATKFIAGGEGGVVASNDETFLADVRAARNPSDQAPNGLHLNDKMTDIEAAIVRVQLGRLAWMLNERELRARRYSELLADFASRGLLILPAAAEGRIWYRYTVRLARGSASAVAAAMQSGGVNADQPVWDLRSAVRWSPRLRATATAFDSVLSLPLYPDLTTSEQARVCDALGRALSSMRS